VIKEYEESRDIASRKRSGSHSVEASSQSGKSQLTPWERSQSEHGLPAIFFQACSKISSEVLSKWRYENSHRRSRA
jgi:hypothetical protein